MNKTDLKSSLKHFILLGVDINIVLLATSILLIPYSFVATVLFDIFSSLGVVMSTVSIILLAIVSISVQLGLLGFTWSYLKARSWMLSMKYGQ
jgi:hypothetical protein